MNSGQGEKQDIDGRLKAVDDAKEANIPFRPIDHHKTGHHASQQGGKMELTGQLAAQEEQGQPGSEHFSVIMELVQDFVDKQPGKDADDQGASDFVKTKRMEAIE